MPPALGDLYLARVVLFFDDHLGALRDSIGMFLSDKRKQSGKIGWVACEHCHADCGGPLSTDLASQRRQFYSHCAIERCDMSRWIIVDRHQYRPTWR